MHVQHGLLFAEDILQNSCVDFKQLQSCCGSCWPNWQQTQLMLFLRARTKSCWSRDKHSKILLKSSPREENEAKNVILDKHSGRQQSKAHHVLLGEEKKELKLPSLGACFSWWKFCYGEWWNSADLDKRFTSHLFPCCQQKNYLIILQNTDWSFILI